MLNLVPSWASDYMEYWDTIRKRNLWLIKLRYGAAAMLFAFWLSTMFLLKLQLTPVQNNALLIINAAILLYNIALHRIRRFLKCEPGKFTPLHFSLLQMIVDLTALLLIVYFTGGIETPLFMLFVFHMIIGSLILPGIVIYSVAVAVMLAFNAMIFAEYFSLIPHYSLDGMLTSPLYQNLHYILAYDVVFCFMIIISVFLANRIAHQLYRMEQRLVESLRKLNAAEIEKQQYIIGIVHEIKTPMAAVHSYLDLLLKNFLGPLDERVKERLVRAMTRSGEAIQMINDVLKISKLRLLDEVAVEDLELHEIIVSTIKKQAANIRAKHIMLTFIDGRTERRTVSGDKFLLEIAFSNLIGNAVKYVGNNGLVEIAITDLERGIEVNISDNGIGIPEQDIGKIFTDFFRASNIKEKSYEGTGLGLSVVKQIIERHNGTISAESPSHLGSDNKPGASFKIFLPSAEKIAPA